MVAPSKRGLRKTVKRSRSGKPAIKYKKRKPNAAICALCATRLHGVPKARPVEMRHLAKTEKRPERKFGGVLCHACVGQLVREQARLDAKEITLRGIDLRHAQYLRLKK